MEVLVRLQLRWLGLRDRWLGEEGATAVEYALMLALIAIVIVGAVTVLGQNTSQKFSEIAPLGGSS
jgi:pilus assembly protein Flp/PilA